MAEQPFTLRWGILATGGIAKTFSLDLLIPPSTRSLPHLAHTITAAASSTSAARAQDFLTSIKAPSSAKAYGSYEELVEDEDVDIVYVATPHSHHYANARLCIEKGKHVLCEKPFCVNEAQARTVVEEGRKRGVFVMEAVWTRCFPVAREVREFVKSGRLGEVVRVWADVSFWNDVEKDFKSDQHRMVNMDLAGGALLDLGIYSLTWIFQILYHIVPEADRGFPKIASSMTKYSTGCDETTSMILTFPPNQAHGIATTGIKVGTTPNAAHHRPPPVRIQGTKGDILINDSPFRPTSYTLVPATSESRGTIADFEYETITKPTPGGGHGMFWEADECARCIRDGKLESELVPLDESLVVMKALDEVRRQGGLIYGDSLEGLEYP